MRHRRKRMSHRLSPCCSIVAGLRTFVGSENRGSCSFVIFFLPTKVRSRAMNYELKHRDIDTESTQEGMAAM